MNVDLVVNVDRDLDPDVVAVVFLDAPAPDGSDLGQAADYHLRAMSSLIRP
jgi:hypothetical protein